MSLRERIWELRYELVVIPVLAAAVSVYILCGLLTAFAHYRYSQEQARFEEYLSLKLSVEVIQDFCSRNLIPENVGDCTEPELILEYRDVPEIVRADIPEDATYRQVDSVFGAYERYCERDPALGWEYEFYCDYQIDTYHFRVEFDKGSGSVLKIRWPAPGS